MIGKKIITVFAMTLLVRKKLDMERIKLDPNHFHSTYSLSQLVQCYVYVKKRCKAGPLHAMKEPGVRGSIASTHS
jgi:hypothetical protein